MSVVQITHSMPDIDEQAEWSLAGEYSALWSARSSPPDLIAFLRSHPGIDRKQRARLLLMDQARRWSDGEGCRVEDYLLVCPGLTDDQELLLKLLVREFHFQEAPTSVTEFIDRFPQLRSQLLNLLCLADGDPTTGQERQLADNSSIGEETAASGIESIDEVSANFETACESGDFDSESASLSLQAATVTTHEPVPAPRPPVATGPCRLRDCFPFDTLPVELMNELESHMSERTFAPGEFLIRQGDPGDSLILIRAGTVNIVVTDEQSVSHDIDHSGPGAILGEMSLLTEAPRTASIIASDQVTALVLAAATFHDYATRNPEISQVLAKLFAERLGGQRRDVLAGKTLDRYRVVRRLGKGGMAIVYEAIEQESAARVALKMLSHRLVYDKSSLAWFQREADIVERFQHPNIVKMFGRFRAFQSYFIVMEYCDGITLERLVRLNGPMNQDDFRKTFGQLATALQYAHEREVIHRDLKPVNLMLNFDGQIKLMDFGLAMPLHAGAADVDAERQVVGTPRYMAPEQLNGCELTTSADYFALGCTAYKLLTGESLFPVCDIIKLRDIHSHWKAPDFHTHRPDFGADICDLLNGCLQRKPHKRTCDLARYADWAAPLDVARLL